MKISVATATWNCAGALADCMDSVARQSYGNREHVVIDGASRDGTLPMLEGRLDKLAVLVSEPDKGIYNALNKGITRCGGSLRQRQIVSSHLRQRSSLAVHFARRNRNTIADENRHVSVLMR